MVSWESIQQTALNIPYLAAYIEVSSLDAFNIKKLVYLISQLLIYKNYDNYIKFKVNKGKGSKEKCQIQ